MSDDENLPMADHNCVYSSMLWATLDGLLATFEGIADKHRIEAQTLVGEARAHAVSCSIALEVAIAAVEMSKRAARRLIVELEETKTHVHH